MFRAFYFAKKNRSVVLANLGEKAAKEWEEKEQELKKKAAVEQKKKEQDLVAHGKALVKIEEMRQDEKDRVEKKGFYRNSLLYTRLSDEQKKIREKYCCICMKETVCPGYAGGFVALPCCRHCFHEECLLKWIEYSYQTSSNATCPYCRHSIPCHELYRMKNELKGRWEMDILEDPATSGAADYGVSALARSSDRVHHISSSPSVLADCTCDSTQHAAPTSTPSSSIQEHISPGAVAPTASSSSTSSVSSDSIHTSQSSSLLHSLLTLDPPPVPPGEGEEEREGEEEEEEGEGEGEE